MSDELSNTEKCQRVFDMLYDLRASVPKPSMLDPETDAAFTKVMSWCAYQVANHEAYQKDQENTFGVEVNMDDDGTGTARIWIGGGGDPDGGDDLAAKMGMAPLLACALIREVVIDPSETSHPDNCTYEVMTFARGGPATKTEAGFLELACGDVARWMAEKGFVKSRNNRDNIALLMSKRIKQQGWAIITVQEKVHERG